jgi:hypothetical protein
LLFLTETYPAASSDSSVEGISFVG